MSFMGTPPSEDTLRLFQLLADNEWHDYGDIKESLAKTIPPGRALRKYEERLVHSRRLHQREPNTKPSVSMDDQIKYGARACAQATITSWYGKGIIHRQQAGRKQIKIKPDFKSWGIPVPGVDNEQEPGKSDEGRAGVPPSDSVASESGPGGPQEALPPVPAEPEPEPAPVAEVDPEPEPAPVAEVDPEPATEEPEPEEKPEPVLASEDPPQAPPHPPQEPLEPVGGTGGTPEDSEPAVSPPEVVADATARPPWAVAAEQILGPRVSDQMFSPPPAWTPAEELLKAEQADYDWVTRDPSTFPASSPTVNPEKAQECPRCAMLVGDEDRHKQWHMSLDRVLAGPEEPQDAPEGLPEPPEMALLNEESLRTLLGDVTRLELDRFQAGMQRYLDYQFAQLTAQVGALRSLPQRWTGGSSSDPWSGT